MNINGIRPSKVVSIYEVNKKQSVKETSKANSDTIEISKVGRSLSNYSLNESTECSQQKIESLKKEISNGTYKPDAHQVAKKLMDVIKGRDI